MCGFVGFVAAQDDGLHWEGVLKAMTQAILHRGPDAGGAWVDREAGVALGHRRLSIVDLSPTGAQPMHSRSERYVIVFNGEIYNFPELRRELEGLGYAFRGTSDTEIMLAAFEQWGVPDSLKRFVGMFAFALWDRAERTLTLARDRLGEKPLYYGWVGNTFLFGSEIKGLRAHPAWNARIDRGALALLLRHNYIPGPYSIYEGVHKLPPASYLTLSSGEPGRLPAPVPYWSLREVAEAGLREPFAGGDREATDALDALLRDAVKGQMMADVPLGAFLSGGIDSSLVVSLMQAQSAQPVKTFTMGFGEEGFNEAPHAKAVAQHLGTDHTELYVSPQQALDVIPRLPTLYDEPFSDASQIPTFLVAQLAKSRVTVSLSGDAGDELFCGYKRYEVGRRLWDKLGLLPSPLRLTAARTLKAAPVGLLNATLGWAAPALGRYGRSGAVGDKLHKLAEVLDVPTQEAMYQRLISHWKNPSAIVRGGKEPPTALTDPARWAQLPTLEQRMMYLDTISYLPDDILVKVDRAAMGVSLEGRVPLLDHRVVEFAWKLPQAMKQRDGRSKWLMRQVLYRYVPKELIERPKMGFGVPLGEWLNGPLREWAEDLLSERRLADEGYFDPAPIREKWAQHASGAYNWQGYLWTILMFQAWLQESPSLVPVKG
ncbi:MAG TPA: asparagine synthase (glutamine-hydrolyzing) [Oscillatoriaceae cyanobacterium]